MIPIENFAARTTVEGVDGKYVCQVVGLVRAGGHFEFVVIVEEDDERWIAQREVVTAPNGAERRPN